MRRGDIGHVEWRVLPKMPHVHLREIDIARMREAIVIFRRILHSETMAAGNQPAVAEREVGRRVIEYVVAAMLRLEQQREGRIAPDIDALDRVHREGDFEGHGVLIVGVWWPRHARTWPGGPGLSDRTRVLYIMRPGPWRGQHHVEAHIGAFVGRMRAEPILRGPHDSSPRPARQCLSRILETPPPLDLEEAGACPSAPRGRSCRPASCSAAPQ